MQTVTDLPKRWNWTRKADISRISSRPALCSWCHLICRYLRSKRCYYYYYYLFITGESFPQLDMNHVTMMLSCTATSKHAHKAAQAWLLLLHAALHRPSIRVCASCWCTQPGHQGRPGPHEGHSVLVQCVISPFGGWDGDKKGTGMSKSQPNYVTIHVGGRCGRNWPSVCSFVLFQSTYIYNEFKMLSVLKTPWAQDSLHLSGICTAAPLFTSYRLLHQKFIKSVVSRRDAFKAACHPPPCL